MAEDYKTNKTKHVMDLITSPRSEANPFLPANIQAAHEKPEQTESTVEDKLRDYTAAKRGKTVSKRKKYKTPQNPSLHIPKEEPEEAEEAVLNETVPIHNTDKLNEYVTIDINRAIISQMLDEALARFNTCHCDNCKNVITEKVLEIVPVKIVTVTEKEKDMTIAKHSEFARKEISSAIIKVVMANKRKPFH